MYCNLLGMNIWKNECTRLKNEWTEKKYEYFGII